MLRVARTNGLSIVVLSGAFAVLSALSGYFIGAMAGLFVAGAGAIEVHGQTLLAHRDPRGMKWLLISEPLVWLGIVMYCAARLIHVDIPPLPDALKSVVALQAQQLGMTIDDYVLTVYKTGNILTAVVSTFYQGGVTVYYLCRRKTVLRALDSEASE